MKVAFTFVILLLTSFFGLSQSNPIPQLNDNTGKLYIYWGWNRAWYSKSNITFTGNNYDFTLDKVTAYDRPNPFSAEIYLNPANITIPQYNFRVGYFINTHYNISIGIDHMKYVMPDDLTVKINGYIESTGTIYDGVYVNDVFYVDSAFLTFEHTDGLNYPNIEFRRFDELYALKNANFNITEGLGAGILHPRSNTKLLNYQRYDEFHLAGYGLSALVGLNITFYKHFFIQSEFKGGFIHMPDIRTTNSVSDKASQHFFFYQVNFVFGATINLKKKKEK
jgi:hypothetical protein